MDYYEPSTHPSLERAPTRQSADRERDPHPIVLKVLRASRPGLTQSKELLEDPTTLPGASTSAFSLTPLLALPTAFGSINLGETFHGVVVAANESGREVFDATLRIEIQTQSSRQLLWESPAPDKDAPRSLAAGEVIEAPLLNYEIREPGLHALTCSVSYWLPAPSSYIDPNGPSERFGRSFRKLYKFQATNPLSVKTKIHSSKNVASAADEALEHTMFLEVQVQNISVEPLLFSKLHLSPADGLEVQDLTMKSRFPVQPGDILQCLYVVKPKSGRTQELVEKARLANGAMGLGRLEIRWSGRMGDSGHLTTSQLVRRLAMPNVPPISAIRPGLHPASSTLATPDRSFRSGPRTPSPLASPHIGTGTATPSPSPRYSMQIDEPSLLPFGTDIQASLYTEPRDSPTVEVGKPFDLRFKLRLLSRSRVRASASKRHLRLAVQHVNHHGGQNQTAQSMPLAEAPASARQSLDTSRPLPPTPRRSIDNTAIDLPPPTVLPEGHPYDGRRPDQRHLRPSQAVHLLGSSLVEIPEVVIDHALEGPASVAADLGDDSRISIDSTATDDVPLDAVARRGMAKRQQGTDVHFSMQYASFSSGIHAVGGLRVILLEDFWLDAESGEKHTGLLPHTLAEHSIVAEVVAI